MTQFVRMHTPGKAMARVVASMHDLGRKRKTLTSEQKRIARHMAHDEKTTQEIFDALKLSMCFATFTRQLRENNIRPGRPRPHPLGSKYGRS